MAPDEALGWSWETQYESHQSETFLEPVERSRHAGSATRSSAGSSLTLHEEQRHQDGGCQQASHSRPVRPVHPPRQPARLLLLRAHEVKVIIHTEVRRGTRLVFVHLLAV